MEDWLGRLAKKMRFIDNIPKRLRARMDEQFFW